MRHGSVDYFRDDGVIVPPDGVVLNSLGRAQADAAGALFAASAVHFDRCITSGLPRTIETARRVLGAAQQVRKVTGGRGPGALTWPGLLRRLDRQMPGYDA